MRAPYKIDSYALTSMGDERRKNEDQYLIADLSKSLLVRTSSTCVDDTPSCRRGHLFAVADGIGGAPAGEVASAVAMRGLVRHTVDAMPFLFGSSRPMRSAMLEEMKQVMQRCQQDVQADSGTWPQSGTTLTVAQVHWPYLSLVHVGDSRAYLFRRGNLRQLTRDHTVAHQLVRDGVMEPENAYGSRWTHVLSDAVGGGENVGLRPDTLRMPLQFEDTLILCSDGLSSHLTEGVLGDVLESTPDSEMVCRRLISGARTAGSSDNITVICARFLRRIPARRKAEAEALNIGG